MDNEKLVGQWQEKIRSECERNLQRQLTNVENNFVRSRRGFIALEMIQDSVSAIQSEELQIYLNSETGS
jgi:hypothetical protein